MNRDDLIRALRDEAEWLQMDHDTIENKIADALLSLAERLERGES